MYYIFTAFTRVPEGAFNDYPSLKVPDGLNLDELVHDLMVYRETLIDGEGRFIPNAVKVLKNSEKGRYITQRESSASGDTLFALLTDTKLQVTFILSLNAQRVNLSFRRAAHRETYENLRKTVCAGEQLISHCLANPPVFKRVKRWFKAAFGA